MDRSTSPLESDKYGMIHDLEYFVTVVVIPHAKLERADLVKLIAKELVISIHFVTNKDGVVALTLANAIEAVIITFEEESTANYHLEGFLAAKGIQKGGVHLERVAALLSQSYSYRINAMSITHISSTTYKRLSLGCRFGSFLDHIFLRKKIWAKQHSTSETLFLARRIDVAIGPRILPLPRQGQLPTTPVGMVPGIYYRSTSGILSTNGQSRRHYEMGRLGNS